MAKVRMRAIYPLLKLDTAGEVTNTEFTRSGNGAAYGVVYFWGDGGKGGRREWKGGEGRWLARWRYSHGMKEDRRGDRRGTGQGEGPRGR